MPLFYPRVRLSPGIEEPEVLLDLIEGFPVLGQCVVTPEIPLGDVSKFGSHEFTKLDLKFVTRASEVVDAIPVPTHAVGIAGLASADASESGNVVCGMRVIRIQNDAAAKELPPLDGPFRESSTIFDGLHLCIHVRKLDAFLLSLDRPVSLPRSHPFSLSGELDYRLPADRAAAAAGGGGAARNGGGGWRRAGGAAAMISPWSMPVR
jgi:hypothetical protein